LEQKWDRLAPNRVLSDRLLELQLVDGRLYLVRPTNGEQLLSPAEAQVARRAAEVRAAQAEAELQRLQAELQRLQRET